MALYATLQTGDIKVVREAFPGPLFTTFAMRDPETEETLLHRVCKLGDNDVATMIISEWLPLDFNELDKEGKSSYWECAANGQPVILKKLLSTRRFTTREVKMRDADGSELTAYEVAAKRVTEIKDQEALPRYLEIEDILLPHDKRAHQYQMQQQKEQEQKEREQQQQQEQPREKGRDEL